MTRKRGYIERPYVQRAVVLMTLLMQAASVAIPKKKADQVLWVDPGRVETKNLFFGPGGRKLRPAPPCRFIREESGGSSPKIRVRDHHGIEWSVKFGPEVHSDNFASRLAWAVGFITEPTYFIAAGRVIGAHNLTRAAHALGPKGAFGNARFQLRSQRAKFSRRYNWSWINNPFQGTKELHGLKVMMMLTSDWDDKDARDVDRDANTAVFEAYARHRSRYVYFIPDWGGSMGKWGNVLTRSKWDSKGYKSQNKEFVRGVRNGYVEWGYSGQHTADLTQGIRVEDVQWLMRYLGRLTDRQIAAALEASGADAEEKLCFGAPVRDRIERLRDLARNPAQWAYR